MLRRVLVFIISFILLVLIAFSSLFAFIYIRHYTAPIAMYHAILKKPNPKDRLAVSEAAFERQMRFLKRHRYNVVPLEELARLIKEKKRIPFKTIAITFDDGYKNNYTYVFPILKKYNLKTTIFVIVDEIGRRDRLSWDEIKEMQASGLITIGSHAMGPGILTEIKSMEEIKRQIFKSKKILEEKLGAPTNTFSYPEGRFNQEIRQLAIGAGYELAVATSPGKRFSSSDIFALKRLRISENANNLFVFWIETSGIYMFIKEHRDED